MATSWTDSEVIVPIEPKREEEIREELAGSKKQKMFMLGS